MLYLSPMLTPEIPVAVIAPAIVTTVSWPHAAVPRTKLIATAISATPKKRRIANLNGIAMRGNKLFTFIGFSCLVRLGFYRTSDANTFPWPRLGQIEIVPLFSVAEFEGQTCHLRAIHRWRVTGPFVSGPAN